MIHSLPQIISGVCLVGMLALTPGGAFAQVTTYPYMYDFNSGAQDPLTGDGNWSTETQGTASPWKQVENGGVGNSGSALLGSIRNPGSVSRLRLLIDPEALPTQALWNFAIRIGGGGTPPSNQSGKVFFQWSADGQSAFHNLDSVSVHHLDTIFVAKSYELPPSLREYSSVYLCISAEAHHNAQSHTSIMVDNVSISQEGEDPLPVQLTRFTATTGKDDVHLQWSTAGEVNNYGFEIERRRLSQIHVGERGSVGAVHRSPLSVHSAWVPIGFVEGAGTSTSPREYSFVDRNVVAGRYAYRIKQIDTDGTSTFMESIEIEVLAPPAEFVLSQNFPNPFNPSTEIMFSIPTQGQASLLVYSVLGQEVAVLYRGEAAARQTYRAVFDASGLPSGIYIARLEHDGHASVRRMILMK